MNSNEKHDLMKVLNNLDMFLQMLEKKQLSESEILEFINDIKTSIKKAKEIISEN